MYIIQEFLPQFPGILVIQPKQNPPHPTITKKKKEKKKFRAYEANMAFNWGCRNPFYIAHRTHTSTIPLKASMFHSAAFSKSTVYFVCVYKILQYI